MNRIKAKYVCKCSMSDSPKNTAFIAGKEYECEYESWTFKEGHRLNGGHRRYWAIGEDGEEREMPRPRFRAVFHTEHEKRDLLIEGILGESPKKTKE